MAGIYHRDTEARRKAGFEQEATEATEGVAGMKRRLGAMATERGCETKFRSGFGNLHKNAVLYIWLNILAKNYCRQEAG